MTYASHTKVDVADTIDEIRRTLRRYGTLEGFGFAEEGNYAGIEFNMNKRRIRIVLPLPDPEELRYTKHNPPRKRTQKQWDDAYEQACREKWRSLFLITKAKLESVAAHVSTFDNEFMAYIVLPDNSTAGEWMGPQIEQAYQTGRMPALLPLPGNRTQTKGNGPIPLPPA